MSENTDRVDTIPCINELLADLVLGTNLKRRTSRYKSMATLSLSSTNLVADAEHIGQAVHLLETCGLEYKFVGSSLIVPHIWMPPREQV